MSKARAHHYLPIFYLKGFTSSEPHDNGFLYVYEQNKPIRKSKPDNEAKQRDFYAFEDEHGALRDAEQGLSQIESQLAPVFKEIENGYHRFHPDDWYGITYFIALQWLRGPSGRDFVNGLFETIMMRLVKAAAEDEKQFIKEYEDFARHTGDDMKFSAEEMRAYVLGGQWKISQESHGYKLKQMFEGTLTVAPILRAKHWELLTSDSDQCFCTSDLPVITILPDGVHRGEMGTGFGVPGVHVYFPVSKRYCLVLMDRAACEKRTIPPGHVREINKFLMIGARRYVYASEKNGHMAEVFSRIGCNSILGKNAFMSSPPAE
jgi:hypothetical protein